MANIKTAIVGRKLDIESQTSLVPDTGSTLPQDLERSQDPDTTDMTVDAKDGFNSLNTQHGQIRMVEATEPTPGKDFQAPRHKRTESQGDVQPEATPSSGLLWVPGFPRDESIQAPRLCGSLSFPLSSCDQVAPRVMFSQALVFEIPKDANKIGIYRSLRKALERLVFETPILAGTLEIEDADRNTFKINTSFGSGMVFRVRDYTTLPGAATWKPCTFSELQARHFPATLLPSEFVLPYLPMPSGPGSPCFAAQMSFIPGGMLLCATVSHIFTDGGGIDAIFDAWAKYTSEPFIPAAFPNNDLSRKDIGRWRLSEGIGEARPQDFPAYRYTTPEELRTSVLVAPAATSDVILCQLIVPPEKLRLLMHTICPNPTAEHWISTIDAIVALVWYCVTLARAVPLTTGKRSLLTMPVSMRSRMEPPLPRGYLGNTAAPTPFFIDLEVMSGNPHEAIRYLAKYIRQCSQNSHVVDEFQRLIGLVNRLEDTRCLQIKYPDPHASTDLMISDLSKFAYLDRSWGAELGVPVALTMLPGALYPGYGSVFPRTKDGSVRLALALERDVAVRLSEDLLLREFAEVGMECQNMKFLCKL